jgi:hypothetical protein
MPVDLALGLWLRQHAAKPGHSKERPGPPKQTQNPGALPGLLDSPEETPVTPTRMGGGGLSHPTAAHPFDATV